MVCALTPMFHFFCAFSGKGASQTQRRASGFAILESENLLFELQPGLIPWVSVWGPITKPLIIWLLYLHVISTLALSSINTGLAVCDLSAKSSSKRIAGVCQIVLREGRGREDCLVDLWLPLWFAALSDLWQSPDCEWQLSWLCHSWNAAKLIGGGVNGRNFNVALQTTCRSSFSASLSLASR